MGFIFVRGQESSKLVTCVGFRKSNVYGNQDESNEVFVMVIIDSLVVDLKIYKESNFEISI